MRHALLVLASLLLAAVALAGCSTSEAGWTYAPPPSETPVPSVDGGSPAPSGDSESPSPGETAGSSAPSGTVVQISALNIQFEQSTLELPADTPFTIEFANNDNGVPHDVDIRDASGASLFKTDIFNGVETRTFEAPALPAGTYQFICSVHPTMVIDVTVE